MAKNSEARRFSGVSRENVNGELVPVASGRLLRLLGLAHLDRERAGRGLLIPDCPSIHTFGMRFPIEVAFLDQRGDVIRTIEALKPRRVAWCRDARAVLELVRSAPGAGDLDQ